MWRWVWRDAPSGLPCLHCPCDVPCLPWNPGSHHTLWTNSVHPLCVSPLEHWPIWASGCCTHLSSGLFTLTVSLLSLHPNFTLLSLPSPVPPSHQHRAAIAPLPFPLLPMSLFPLPQKPPCHRAHFTFHLYFFNLHLQPFHLCHQDLLYS